MNINSIQKAKKCLLQAWPNIKEECLSVFGSELHYQAMVYHCLRTYGEIPSSQLGMNVKMWIDDPVSELFIELDRRKHPDYQGGFEPIPDVVIFKPKINSDWRRRKFESTLANMLIAIEVKASERMGKRLRSGEIISDIKKLAAHREEVQFRDSNMLPVMMVIDSASNVDERMTKNALELIHENADKLNVGLLYCSPIADTTVPLTFTVTPAG